MSRLREGDEVWGEPVANHCVDTRYHAKDAVSTGVDSQVPAGDQAKHVESAGFMRPFAWLDWIQPLASRHALEAGQKPAQRRHL